MLAEAEDGVIDAIKGSTLGNKLAAVAGLPDLEGDSLVKRFAAEAPAVYVAPADFPVMDGSTALKFGLACVARNSRGHDAARKGDGVTIGLYQMMEAVAALMDNRAAGGATWRVTGGDFMADEKLYQAGLQVGVIRIETTGPVSLPPGIDETALAAFKTLHADYDVDPHVSTAEHNRWLQEPADHSVSAPDLTDQLNLQ